MGRRVPRSTPKTYLLSLPAQYPIMLIAEKYHGGVAEWLILGCPWWYIIINLDTN